MRGRRSHSELRPEVVALAREMRESRSGCHFARFRQRWRSRDISPAAASRTPRTWCRRCSSASWLLRCTHMPRSPPWEARWRVQNRWPALASRRARDYSASRKRDPAMGDVVSLNKLQSTSTATPDTSLSSTAPAPVKDYHRQRAEGKIRVKPRRLAKHHQGHGARARRSGRTGAPHAQWHRGTGVGGQLFCQRRLKFSIRS